MKPAEQAETHISPGRERVQADASARGLDIEFFEHASAANGRVARAAGVKSMVVQRSDDAYLFVLVPHDRLISWPKLRSAVGVNRLHLPDAATAFTATGHRRGTISPLGSTTAWPVYVDATLVDAPTLRLGGGQLGIGVLVDSRAMIRAFHARIADLTRAVARHTVWQR